MKQLILGTAQLGVKYGINNLEGKPSRDKSFDILNTAYEKGIRILDTASAYGDSEEIIGSFMKNTGKEFKIATKLSKLDNTQDIVKQVEQRIKSSIGNLGISKIDYYLYHSFQDLTSKPQVFEYLQVLKNKSVIKNLGVSIYDVEELNFIVNNLSESIDVIQLPFNIFDLRWLKGEFLTKAKEKGIKIAVRSVFLQGLFFLNKDKAVEIHSKAYDYITKLKKLASIKRLTIEQMAFSFVKKQECIDYIVIGCENSEQLIDNVNSFNKNIEFTKEDLNFINKNFGKIEKTITDPRLWQKVTK